MRSFVAEDHEVTFVSRSSLRSADNYARIELLTTGRLHTLSASSDKFATLLRTQHFHFSFTPLWFWQDISVAEEYLPVLRELVPEVFNVVLTDDCHASREEMLSTQESIQSEKERSARFAEELRIREVAVQNMADFVAFITTEDLQLCCNTPLSDCGVVRAAPIPRATSTVSPLGWQERDGVAFVGNGPNPTNYLAINWFLNYVWPLLRQRLPKLQLHLIGELPSWGRACGERKVRCSWTEESPYAGLSSAASGIVQHGRVADLSSLLSEMRVFISPIPESTGVNTKGFLAFEFGLPLVATPKGSTGMMITAAVNASQAGMLIVSGATHFVDAVAQAYSNQTLWTMLSSNARTHFAQLVANNLQHTDTIALLSTIRARIG